MFQAQCSYLMYLHAVYEFAECWMNTDPSISRFDNSANSLWNQSTFVKQQQKNLASTYRFMGKILCEITSSSLYERKYMRYSSCSLKYPGNLYVFCIYYNITVKRTKNHPKYKIYSIYQYYKQYKKERNYFVKTLSLIFQKWF